MITLTLHMIIKILPIKISKMCRITSQLKKISRTKLIPIEESYFLDIPYFYSAA